MFITGRDVSKALDGLCAAAKRQRRALTFDYVEWRRMVLFRNAPTPHHAKHKAKAPFPPSRW